MTMYEQIKQQLPELLAIQNTLNCEVHDNWVAQNYPWYRAALIEATEAMGHFGWKWWKAETPDIAQVKLELVDIFCFLLSELMQVCNRKGAPLLGDSAHYEYIAGSYSRTLQSYDFDKFKPAVESFIRSCAGGSIPLHQFWNLCAVIGLDWQELRLLYLGKQALNHLRQENGYKEGTYIKIWDGREDNCHLMDLIDITKFFKADTVPATEVVNHIKAQLQSIYDVIEVEYRGAA